MELNETRQHILREIEGAAKIIVGVSHQIHANPELGYEERFASELLCETLERFEFTLERGYVDIPTAFYARKGQGGRPKVAFLAEYDALPGVGHGCGHNIIGTAALAAGIGLGAVVEESGGEVWVVGTPAEETDGAKVEMVKRGAFREVDAVLMVHPYVGNYTLTEALAMDAIEVTFRGKPAHAAASPWEGINAMDALVLTFNNINALRQQIKPDGRIHGIITEGGKAPNIIPDYTQARFYVRAKQRSYLNSLVDKFRACAQAAATATGASVEFRNYQSSYDDMNNNKALANRMVAYLTQALGAGNFQQSPDSFGSVDMGNVSHVAPAVHVLVDISDGKQLALHTPEFRDAAVTPYADAALLRAGKALALTGYDVLSDGEFLQAVREEFRKELVGGPAGGTE